MQEAANSSAAAAAQAAPTAAPAASGIEALLGFRLLEIGGNVLTVGGVIGSLTVVLVMMVLSRLIGRAIKRFGERSGKANTASFYTVSRVIHYVLLALGIVWALDALGIPVSKFTVFAGALGVGLGFGLQQIFNNFVSGLILLFDRSLKVGDFVQLDDNARGIVKAINIRFTRITTSDNIDMLVPNSEFVSKRVTNWTYHSMKRRLRVSFGVAYGVDKELVKKAALEAAANVPFTLPPEGRKVPQVWLNRFGESSVEFILAVWLTEAAARRNTSVRAAYLWELDTAFKKYGIELPFPQRDLRVRSLFGLEGAEALKALRGEAALQSPCPPPPAPHHLSDEERRLLAQNDARVDAEREIDEARQAEDATNDPETEKHDGQD